MLVTTLGLLLVSLLGLLVLPVPRVRQFLLTILTRFSQATLLAGLGACGTFLITPESAPAWAKPVVSPFVDMNESLYGRGAPAGLPWLTLAVCSVTAALPLLIGMELAIGLTRQQRLVQSFHNDLRHATDWVDSRLNALGLGRMPFPLPSESAAMADAIRDPEKKPGKRTPLVIDLISK